MTKKIRFTIASLVLFTSILFLADAAFAQNAQTVGDICGGVNSAKKVCGLEDFGKVLGLILKGIVVVGLPYIIVMICYRFLLAWFAAKEGSSSAYHEALKKAWQSTLGFIIIILVFGGAVTVLLKYLGATDPVTKLIEMISNALIPHAYAQGEYLPSPIRDTDLYSFILTVLRLVMKFFVYPALIIVWAWTGFSFVAAQGAPAEIAKAKKLLVGAFISTFVVMMIQGFLIAIQGTVNQILPTKSALDISPEKTISRGV